MPLAASAITFTQIVSKSICDLAFACVRAHESTQADKVLHSSPACTSAMICTASDDLADEMNFPVSSRRRLAICDEDLRW